MYKILSLEDHKFAKYGRVIRDYDFTELLKVLESTPVTESVEYVAGVKILEELAVRESLSRHFYGQMPVQIGYCNGVNEENDYLEYHRSSEINVAGTDMILVLGLQCDIDEDYRYDNSMCEAFLVPKGTAVELYATTLHYAPISVNHGSFRVAVVLPEGTNLELASHTPVCKEDELLVARNKWLIKL